jgi:alkylated DNA repair dioxygenase AlkB
MIKSVDKVPGLYVSTRNYIDVDADYLIKKIDELKWEPIGNRLVQHYGFKYNYRTRDINTRAPELPEFLEKYKLQLTNECRALSLTTYLYEFNQCIINNYYSGNGISPHVDNKKYGDVIGCISIGAGVLMNFIKNDESQELINVYIPPNSMYIISGKARTKYLHGIARRKYDYVNGDFVKRKRRVSITFRRVPTTTSYAYTGKVSYNTSLYESADVDSENESVSKEPEPDDDDYGKWRSSKTASKPSSNPYSIFNSYLGI